jgi:hypothetical protein
MILKTAVQATKTKKPLTTETQRKTWESIVFKRFLCVSVVNGFRFIAPDSPIG